MRYISAAPHRSQNILSSAAGFDVEVAGVGVVVGREAGRSGLSGIARDYRIFPKLRKLGSIESLRFVNNLDNSSCCVLTYCAI